MFLADTIVMMRKLVRIAAVAASGGTALPVVVMALGTAMIMFGASDTIEGIGDIQAAISRQGLDQMSYNPVRESVFGGNETAYTLTETGVSFVFDVITGMAIAKMPTRLKPPAQAFRATSNGAEMISKSTDSQKILWGRWNDYPKIKINGNEYAEIGNRLYTRHAVARMQPSGMRYTNLSAGGKIKASRIIEAGELDYGRSIPPDIIEQVIKNGTKSIVQVGEIERQIFTLGTVEVVTEQAGKLIVTILTH